MIKFDMASIFRSEKQNGMVSPADFTYRDCPPMQKPAHVSIGGAATVSPPSGGPQPVPAPRTSQENVKRASHVQPQQQRQSTQKESTGKQRQSQEVAIKRQSEAAKRQSAPAALPATAETTESSGSDADNGNTTSDGDSMPWNFFR